MTLYSYSLSDSTTSTLALSFYIPAILGRKFIPALLIGFIITDFFIGLHGTTAFTWGSIVLIGLISNSLKSNINYRILGSLLGACLFFIITNFGVWLTSSFYEKSINGLLNCYIMGIPFFTNTLLSTILFVIAIEFFIFSKYFQSSFIAFKK